MNMLIEIKENYKIFVYKMNTKNLCKILVKERIYRLYI